MDKEGREAKRVKYCERLRTSVTVEQKQLIEYWADRDDRTLSQFLRIAAMKYINTLKSQEAIPEMLEYMKQASMELGDAVDALPPSERSHPIVPQVSHD